MDNGSERASNSHDRREVFHVRNEVPYGNVPLEFVDVCQTDSLLRGFVSVKTVIDMDEDVAGYHVLRYEPATRAGARLLDCPPD